MTLDSIIADLGRRGVRLRLAADGGVRVVPAEAVPLVRELVAPLGGADAVADWLRTPAPPGITCNLGERSDQPCPRHRYRHGSAAAADRCAVCGRRIVWAIGVASDDGDRVCSRCWLGRGSA